MTIARLVETRSGAIERLFGFGAIALATVFVVGPLLAVVIDGLGADILHLVADPAVQRATLTSIAIAIPAASCAVAMAASLLAASSRTFGSPKKGIRRLSTWLSQEGAGLVLVLSPVMLGAGWFILLRSVIDPFAAAPVMIIAVNALMALPFALRMLGPGWRESAARNDRLALSLGLRGWRRLWRIERLALSAPLLSAFGFAFALSLGDLGAVALWGSDAVQTLPWLLYGRLGAYRSDDAAGLALILAMLCAFSLLVADRGIRRS